MGKTPSNSSTMAWWWWRSVALQQGFAKHRERRGGREVGLRQGEVQTHVTAALKTSTIYRGEGGGCACPRVPTPRGAAAPKTHLGWRPRGGEGGNLPPKQGGGAPSPNPRRLGPLWGAHQPTWGWSPPTLGPCSPLGPVAPLGGPPGPSRWSRYITDIARNFPVSF